MSEIDYITSVTNLDNLKKMLKDKGLSSGATKKILDITETINSRIITI